MVKTQPGPRHYQTVTEKMTEQRGDLNYNLPLSLMSKTIEKPTQILSVKSHDLKLSDNNEKPHISFVQFHTVRNYLVVCLSLRCIIMWIFTSPT